MNALHLLAFLAGFLAVGAVLYLFDLRRRTYVSRIYEPDLTTTIVVGPEARSRRDAELGALERFQTLCRMAKRPDDLHASQIVTRRVS